MYDTSYKNYGLPTIKLFEKLEWLYQNNGYYEHYKYPGTDIIHSLMNPTNRSVEWFVSKIASKISINTQNTNIQEAIERILTWSNYESNKPVFLRKFSLLGNLLLKVCSSNEKVWFEMVDVMNVQNIKTNKKGYIQEITIAVPMGDHTFVEYWNKEYMATWKTQLTGENFTLEQLGTPEYTAMLSELGIDFVPFVLLQFKNVGDDWGVGAVNHAMDKIDSANRQMSKIQDLLSIFNNALTVIRANQVDSNGLPVPPPLMKETNTSKLFTDPKGTVVTLPGTADLNTVVPDIKYSEALEVLNRQMQEIEDDLPELKANKLSENASGKSLRLQLGSAIARAEEAENNFVDGIQRVIEICLTVGSFHKIFSGVGTYEYGYDFEIIVPDMFQMDDMEKAGLLKELVIAGMPLVQAMRICQYSEEFILQTIEEKTRESINPLDQEIIKSLG